jgi:hypothetical protein
MGFEIVRKLDSDCFFIQKMKRSDIELEYYIDRIEFNNYFIFKSTNLQREVSVEDFYEFEYAQYTFFHKDKYSALEITESLKYMREVGMTMNFMNKPLPRLEHLKKIKTIESI